MALPPRAEPSHKSGPAAQDPWPTAIALRVCSRAKGGWGCPRGRAGPGGTTPPRPVSEGNSRGFPVSTVTGTVRCLCVCLCACDDTFACLCACVCIHVLHVPMCVYSCSHGHRGLDGLWTSPRASRKRQNQTGKSLVTPRVQRAGAMTETLRCHRGSLRTLVNERRPLSSQVGNFTIYVTLKSRKTSVFHDGYPPFCPIQDSTVLPYFMENPTPGKMKFAQFNGSTQRQPPQ